MITSKLEEFRGLIRYCEEAAEKPESGKAQIVGYVLHSLAELFGSELLKSENEPLLISKLALWHFKMGRYFEAAIMMQEFMMNYCARLTDINRAKLSRWGDIDFQDQVHRHLKDRKSSNSVVGQFKADYMKLKDYRNLLCHGKHLVEAELIDFGWRISRLTSVYSRHLHANPENEEALRTLLGKISV